MEQTKRKKELQFTKSTTPDISDDQQVSDGYQSDGESSDLSARAEEIADQVLADEQSKLHCCYCANYIIDDTMLMYHHYMLP